MYQPKLQVRSIGTEGTSERLAADIYYSTVLPTVGTYILVMAARAHKLQ